MIAAERFFDKLERHGRYGCWEWVGFKIPDGYGRYKIGKRSWLTHRLAYELAVGPIPEGLEIDHLCGNRVCCNPAHLEPVTHAVNVRRGRQANRAKTHCPNGHEYAGSNLYVCAAGRRHCRACNNEASRRARERRMSHNLTQLKAQ